jgi:phosphopentomutase
VQPHCTKSLSGFSTGFIVSVCLSKRKKLLTGMFIGVKIVARNGMQSSSENHTQNASRKSFSLKQQQKLGYSNQNEKTMRIYTFVTLSSLKGKN